MDSQTSKTVAPRPASENILKPVPAKPIEQNAKPQPVKPIEHNIDKGKNVTQVNVTANRASTGSTDSVFIHETPAKSSSNLQVQKNNLPTKSPPACK